jgi:hypothetical protein
MMREILRMRWAAKFNSRADNPVLRVIGAPGIGRVIACLRPLTLERRQDPLG